MVFSSVAFLYFFLPVFLLLYWVLPLRPVVLLTASLFFYAWGWLTQCSPSLGRFRNLDQC